MKFQSSKADQIVLGIKSDQPLPKYNKLNKPKIVIVGAGPSGLALAHYLSKYTDSQITVIDRETTIGGCHRVRSESKTLRIQQNSVIFGSLRAKNRITVVDGVTVHGNVEGGSTVYVKKGAHILGDVIAKSIVLHEEATVDGTIEPPHGMRIERGP